MHLFCPHCTANLNRKNLFFKSITTCESCGKNSCAGNFWQWLAAALVAFISLFALLFVVTDFDKPLQSVLVLGGTLFSFAVAVLLLVRPVAYSAGSTQTRNES